MKPRWSAMPSWLTHQNINFSGPWNHIPQGLHFKIEQPYRQGCGVAVLNGKIYVAGGLSTSEAPLDTAEMYDPASDSWTKIKAEYQNKQD